MRPGTASGALRRSVHCGSGAVKESRHAVARGSAACYTHTMGMQTVALSLLFSVLPISELRVAIPFALARGASPIAAYLLCVAANLVIAPAVFLFLSTLDGLLCRSPRYRRLHDRLLERSRARVKPKVDKYGYVGLLLFVALPLPVTGAYTGAVGAWVLGMERKRSFLAISLGVMTAGIVVTTVSALGIAAFSFVTA